MRLSNTIAIFMGVFLLLSSISASAASMPTTWTAFSNTTLPDKPYADIQSVSVTSNASTWDFTLLLASNPTVGGITYSIYFGSMGGDDLFNDSQFSVDANSSVKRNKIVLSYSGTNWTTDGTLGLASAGQSGTSLFWSVNKDDVGLASFYFGGQTSSSSTGEVYEKSNVAATPVPSAALLLGSGLVGLVGLKRRKRQTI